MKPLLLTGFEPFGGDALNPSWQVAQALDGLRIGSHVVCARQLPCVFGRGRGGALRVLDAALRELQPPLVVCLGLAAGRAELSLERVAINVDDARIADNAGAQPVDKPIVTRAPAAYFSTLPIKAMAQALQEAGHAAAVSQTAGTFVCNHVFYGLMHRLARAEGRVRGGFIHVPASSAMADLPPSVPVWPQAQIVAAVQMALEVAVARRRDVKVGGGAVA